MPTPTHTAPNQTAGPLWLIDWSTAQ